MGCDKTDSMDCGWSDSMGCDESDSMGCDRPDSIGCYGSDSVGCDRPDSIGCDGSDGFVGQYRREMSDWMGYGRSDRVGCGRSDRMGCGRSGWLGCGRSDRVGCMLAPTLRTACRGIHAICLSVVHSSVHPVSYTHLTLPTIVGV